MLFVRFCKFVYDVAYYYFAPYLVLILIYFYGQSDRSYQREALVQSALNKGIAELMKNK